MVSVYPVQSYTETQPIAFALSELGSLRAKLVGQLFVPGSTDYDEARKTIYPTIDRHPLAIVRAANADDIAAAVNFARSRALPLSVRSGGHSLASFGVIDGALMVDLSAMKSVQIDPETRIARVQAGATSRDLAGPAVAHGLALSTGDTASVGMGGLVTGGGIGFMVRKFGLAIDNLLAAQVVTASGEIVTASADEHADLFWAIRGGGGNFGIVAEFTFQLASVPQILGGVVALPATAEVIRGYLDYASQAPDDLTTIANVMYAPPMPFVPQEHVGKLVLAILVTWTGSVEDGERALAPLRALATPVAEMVAPMPYPGMYTFTDHQTMPHAAVVRSMFADELSDETINATLDAMNNASSPFSLVQIRAVGGAMSRVGSDATAFAHRHQPYFVAIIGLWLDLAADRQAHEDWVVSLFNAIRHDGSGVYVNFLEEEGADRIHDAYPAVTYARLTEIKRQYDPKNLFRFNQNIAPR